MHPFSTPWKHQKTLRFSDAFMGWRKGALGTNGLKYFTIISEKRNLFNKTDLAQIISRGLFLIYFCKEFFLHNSFDIPTSHLPEKV